MSDFSADPLSAAAVISRLAQVLGAPNDAAVARALGMPATTLNSRKTRNAVPYAECVQLSQERGYSLDWLLTGRGEKAAAVPAPGLDEDLLAWTVSGVLEWLERERAESAPEPTSRLVIGTFRVIVGLSPRPETRATVAERVNGILDGFRHLIK